MKLSMFEWRDINSFDESRKKSMYNRDGHGLGICVDNCKLTSLNGSPEIVGTFTCDNNLLSSLGGGPKRVNGYFSCKKNKLTSLNGAPTFIHGSLYCHENLLRSLHNIHKIIPEIHVYAYFNNNPIESHVLGLLKIKGLEHVYLVDEDDADDINFIDAHRAEKIINKYIKGDRNIMACQEEMLDVGLEAFAQL